MNIRKYVGLFCALMLALSMFVPNQSVEALASWPVVRKGDNGTNVVTLQYLLLQRGHTLSADGAFGPGTESVVKSFQTSQGLVADGIVGANTWSKVVVTVDKGANNNAVKALQEQLRKHGYSISVDGAFGPATETAVLDFKTKHYLGGGSTVGATTWQELLGSGSGASGNYALPLAKSVLPRTEYDDPHHDYPAIDLGIITGTSLYAMTAGTAYRVNDSRCGYGYSISADDGATYVYCHLNSFVVASGARVTAGQLLGYSGNTGHSTGPHLHLGIKHGGIRRCPQQMLLALYDGTSVPHPSTLPSSGCSY